MIAFYQFEAHNMNRKACGPFRQAVEYKNLSSDIQSYDYCDTWPVQDTPDFDGCTDCLRAGDNHYLANCEHLPYVCGWSNADE